MKLFYRKYGQGPPLIILHGLYGSSDNWSSIAKRLVNNFTVYLPDLRNHGQSPHDNTHDYESMSKDIYELASDLKINKFFLAGHSMGGKIAISFALKWPEMINGMLIADISPFIDENSNRKAYNQHLEILNAILSIDLSGISTRNEAEVLLREKISSEKIRGFILKNLQRTTGNNFAWKINPQSLLNNLGKIMKGVDRNFKAGDRITGFPLFFLKGANSDYLPSGDFKDIQKVFPAAEFVTVENAGHWLHADQPDVIVQYLIRLLGDN